MIREEEATWILDQLEQLAAKLGVIVRFETLEREDDLQLRGGSCRLRGAQLIIVDKHRTQAEKCRILAEELKRFDLSKIFVTPAIRGLLEE